MLVGWGDPPIVISNSRKPLGSDDIERDRHKYCLVLHQRGAIGYIVSFNVILSLKYWVVIKLKARTTYLFASIAILAM